MFCKALIKKPSTTFINKKNEVTTASSRAMKNIGQEESSSTNAIYLDNDLHAANSSIFRSEERDASSIPSPQTLCMLSRARPIREDSIGNCDHPYDDDMDIDMDTATTLLSDRLDYTDNTTSKFSDAIMLSWHDAVEDEIIF